MRIIIDAMGGDNAPQAPIRGAVMARKEYDCSITLVGQEDVIRKVLEEDGIDQLPPGIDIVNATEVVEICDNPSTAWREKKDSSLTVGLKMLKDNKGDAFISAGSTGALLSAGTLIVKRIPGIRRAAVAPIVPTGAGSAVLIDAGANSDCTAEYLCQFALMGSFYAQRALGRKNAKVGLLNIGAEPSKGTEFYKQVHEMLADMGERGKINFVGNTEPNAVASEDAPDVIVADGFTGNILLKAMEGTAAFLLKNIKKVFTANMKTKLGYLMVKDNLGDLKKLADSRETGGTAFLGLRKAVFKAHGSSDAYAICRAVGKAVEFVDAHIIEAITEQVESIQPVKNAE
ncbi:MAG: phosphate acyltransferase PlsX [Oscillospiraceae bacterium]|nr:phosphate acyltransferase PlsX [Oscillospiraceae bacterium]